jgi:hypothetical protein
MRETTPARQFLVISAVRSGSRVMIGRCPVTVLATSESRKVPWGVLLRFVRPDGRVVERHFSGSKQLERAL